MNGANRVVWKNAPFAAASGLLLLATIGFRHPLERSMAVHMLVQLPLLLLAGAMASVAVSGFAGGRTTPAAGAFRDTLGKLHRALRHQLGQYDEHGVVGLFAVILTTAYWMIPKALDDALVSRATELGKFGSLLLIGFLLPGILGRANRIIQIFFLGNFSSMMAIVGMLYQDAPARLCNFYLLDDQGVAGQGLVAFAVAIPLFWCVREFRLELGRQARPPA